MDVFELTINGKQKHFLITVDHYYDFFEMYEMAALSAQVTIRACRTNFERYGIPRKILTYNGTNFTNSEFKNFACNWELKHETSSQHHQQANGKAESAVKIAKTLMKKYKFKKN